MISQVTRKTICYIKTTVLPKCRLFIPQFSGSYCTKDNTFYFFKSFKIYEIPSFSHQSVKLIAYDNVKKDKWSSLNRL